MAVEEGQWEHAFPPLRENAWEVDGPGAVTADICQEHDPERGESCTEPTRPNPISGTAEPVQSGLVLRLIGYRLAFQREENEATSQALRHVCREEFSPA